MTALGELPTPCLVLDRDRLEANLARMAKRAKRLGVSLRPHVKTHKCIEIARRQIEHGALGITVSTLYEARTFAEHGFDDIVWAFPVILGRLGEVVELASRIRFGVVVDSRKAVDALESLAVDLGVWLKVDSGYHRAGVDPMGELAVELAERLASSGTLSFAGLLSHSGHAYACKEDSEVRAIAAQERSCMVLLGQRLSLKGVTVPAISVGSTPTMTRVESLPGVSEARPGNYALFDHTQVVLGSCAASECAVTVLSTVVSVPEGAQHSVIDAGALALSVEASHPLAPQASMGEIYQDYDRGRLADDLRVTSVSQEHGIVSGRLKVGERVRILPNHSCLAVACHDQAWVVEGEAVVGRWKIHRGRD